MTIDHYIFKALKDLQANCSNDDFCFKQFLIKHNLPMRFYGAVLKIGLISERKVSKKYKYKWEVDEPTFNDVKFIKSFF